MNTLKRESKKRGFDIFISYAREDADQVRFLVKAFEIKGLKVFWDNIIPPGLTWRKFIMEALNSSKLIVAVWSKYSISSEWVIEEAEHGKQLEILIPVRIDDVALPLGFGGIQTTNLVNLKSQKTSCELELFVEDIISRLSYSEDSGQLNSNFNYENKKPNSDFTLKSELGLFRNLPFYSQRHKVIVKTLILLLLTALASLFVFTIYKNKNISMSQFTIIDSVSHINQKNKQISTNSMSDIKDIPASDRNINNKIVTKITDSQSQKKHANKNALKLNENKEKPPIIQKENKPIWVITPGKTRKVD